ncbi:MAG TPA: SIMPL domain-containing protein [Longimicrobiales bacterium]|nr:SIMPL domain-containing protein [Longimicrobiales bacterium]
MIGSRQLYVLVAALAACAGSGTPGQADAAPAIETVRPNIYEVAPEQVASAQQAPVQEAPFIEVSGQASVELPADQAEISFAMETRADEASAAAGENAEEMTRVLQAIRSAGLPGLEIETFGYSLQPQYSTNDQRVRSIVGYVAYNNIRVTIDDVDQLGRLIDLAVGAGANRVASISFSASDTEAARAQALAEAVANARAQAQAIAASLGYALGPPLEVRGGAQRPPPIAFEAMRSVQAQSAPTPIEAGSQSVDANVTIRFALGGEVAPR